MAPVPRDVLRPAVLVRQYPRPALGLDDQRAAAKVKGNHVPTYVDVNVNAASGFILNPSFSRILCEYPHDGGTAQRTCDPPGVSAECVPGCYNFDREGGGSGWCDSDVGVQACAWRPEHMDQMLEAQRSVDLVGGEPVYNEVKAHLQPKLSLLFFRRSRVSSLVSVRLYPQVVVDMADWQRWMPKGIEAVWFIRHNKCSSGGSMRCESYARTVHNMLLQTYHLKPEELPLAHVQPVRL